MEWSVQPRLPSVQTLGTDVGGQSAVSSVPRVGRDVTPVSTMLRTVAGLCLTTGRLRDKYHAHSLDLKVFFPPRVSWQTFRVIGEDIGIETAVELGEKNIFTSIECDNALSRDEI